MGRRKPQLDEEAVDLAFYHRVAEEVAILDRAAKRLRRLGWSWFFLFGVSLFVSLLLAGFGAFRPLVPFVIVGIALLGVSLFYFGLARYVARGRRWAIGTALFLVAASAAVLLLMLLTPRQVHIVWAVVQALYLLGTLNLLKSLVQSWGASRRLWRLAEVVEDDDPLDAVPY